MKWLRAQMFTWCQGQIFSQSRHPYVNGWKTRQSLSPFALEKLFIFILFIILRKKCQLLMIFSIIQSGEKKKKSQPLAMVFSLSKKHLSNCYAAFLVQILRELTLDLELNKPNFPLLFLKGGGKNYTAYWNPFCMELRFPSLSKTVMFGFLQCKQQE